MHFKFTQGLFFNCFLGFFSFLKDFIYLFIEKGGREGERKRNTNVWLPFTHPQPGIGPQPRHVPYCESNQRPFGLQVSDQPTESHQPGLPRKCLCLGNTLPSAKVVIHWVWIGHLCLFKSFKLIWIHSQVGKSLVYWNIMWYYTILEE